MLNKLSPNQICLFILIKRLIEGEGVFWDTQYNWVQKNAI